MERLNELEHTRCDLKAITELAAGLLQIIGGVGSVDEVARQIEEAARAIRQHVEAGGSAAELVAQALSIQDALALADRIRSVVSSGDEDRDSIESLHQYALDAIRTGAVREAAAVLEGNRIKGNRARQEVLFGVKALIDAEQLRLDFLEKESRDRH